MPSSVQVGPLLCSRLCVLETDELLDAVVSSVTPTQHTTVPVKAVAQRNGLRRRLG